MAAEQKPGASGVVEAKTEAWVGSKKVLGLSRDGDVAAEPWLNPKNNGSLIPPRRKLVKKMMLDCIIGSMFGGVIHWGSGPMMVPPGNLKAEKEAWIVVEAITEAWVGSKKVVGLSRDGDVAAAPWLKPKNNGSLIPPRRKLVKKMMLDCIIASMFGGQASVVHGGSGPMMVPPPNLKAEKEAWIVVEAKTEAWVGSKKVLGLSRDGDVAAEPWLKPKNNGSLIPPRRKLVKKMILDCIIASMFGGQASVVHGGSGPMMVPPPNLKAEKEAWVVVEAKTEPWVGSKKVVGLSRDRDVA